MPSKKRPYIESSFRAITGLLMLSFCIADYIWPEQRLTWLSLLAMAGFMLLQSGFTQFCFIEKILKRLGLQCRMDEIRSMALHDALTGLPNRVLLEDRTEIAISQATRNSKKVAMLFIDLDNFKQVNDIYGHKTGDQLIIAVSKAIQDKLRPYDTLARWGGDEFVVVLPDQDNLKNIRMIAEKIMTTAITDLLPDKNIQVTFSIGAAVYPDNADSTEALLIQADKALFYAKSRGRNNIQIFSEIQETKHGFLNFGLTTRFAETIKKKELQVHYQPIVNAETNKVTCIEALARWHDEKNGWISPVMFIPLAEDLGLIEELGIQIFEKALSDFSTCPGKDQIKLAINVSNRQLFSNNFLATIKEKLEQYKLTPQHLKIEITESIALDTNKAKNTLHQLAEAGFEISLDDFGTGFSSLSRLHELPVNELKIDMSFVRRITTEEGKIMLQTIVDMGKAMKLNLVAEGVEAEETVYALRLMGVQNLQGYYFSRPLPHKECLQFISNNIQQYSDDGLPFSSREKKAIQG